MANPLLSRLANTRVALHLRHLLGVRPPDYIPDFRETVSDLFLWRCDDEWETCFDLMHLAGLLNPEARQDYAVLIVLYADTGTEISRHRFTVRFAASQLVRLNDLLGSPPCRHGTFAVAHLASVESIFGPEAACLAERGYVSYRRKQDASPLRSYVHGNLYGIGARPATGRMRALAQPSRRVREYQPQVRLDGCQFCEIALVNYSPRALTVQTIAITAGAVRGARMDTHLPSRASALIDTRSLPLERVALRAPVPMPRPLLFKHYESHFDVFHG